MPYVQPTNGTTWGAIRQGSFPATYDNNTDTWVQFDVDQSFFSTWWWSTPVYLTGIRIHTRNMEVQGNKNYIYMINNAPNGNWDSTTNLWVGTVYPTQNAWTTIMFTTPIITNGFGIAINVGSSVYPYVEEIQGIVPTYTLTLNVVGNGTITAAPACCSPFPCSCTYNGGQYVNLTATPSSGWRFVQWSGNISSTSPIIDFYITSNMSLTATFEEITGPTYTLTLHTNPSYCSYELTGWGSGTTDGSGNALLTGITPGWHTLNVMKSGYSPYTETINFQSNLTRNITLTPSGGIDLEYSISCIPSATCGYDIPPPLTDNFECADAAKVCSQIYYADGVLDGKTWRLEWHHSEYGPPIDTQSILMSGNYHGWWYPWTKTPCADYGPGFCWIDHYVDDVFIGNSNAFQFIGQNTTAIIDTVSSIFHPGPFNQGDFEIIDIIYVGNIGDAGIIYRKYYYQRNSEWIVLTTTIAGNTVPAIFEQFFNAGTPSNPTYNSFMDHVYIPSDVTGDVLFGVKVWGETENEPAWGSLGTMIFQINSF